MVSRRVRIFLWVAVLAALTAILVMASVAFIIMRTISSTPAAPQAANDAFGEIRRLYPGRPPLIEVLNVRTGEVRINRTPDAPRKKVETIYFMYWDPEEGKIVRGEAPTWITNLRVSIFGVGNWSFSDIHVTRADIERHAPGIIIDFKAPDGAQAIAWTR